MSKGMNRKCPVWKALPLLDKRKLSGGNGVNFLVNQFASLVKKNDISLICGNIFFSASTFPKITTVLLWS